MNNHVGLLVVILSRQGQPYAGLVNWRFGVIYSFQSSALPDDCNGRYLRGQLQVTPEEAIEFVALHGIVLESAKGPVPNLADTVAGERIQGSYWGHPMGDEIFMLTRTIRSSVEILVCRLVEGKVTYVHERLWPAIFRLQANYEKENLGAIQEIHTSFGKHKVSVTPFPDWVPANAIKAAERLTVSEASSQMGEWF